MQKFFMALALAALATTLVLPGRITPQVLTAGGQAGQNLFHGAEGL